MLNIVVGGTVNTIWDERQAGEHRVQDVVIQTSLKAKDGTYSNVNYTITLWNERIDWFHKYFAVDDAIMVAADWLEPQQYTKKNGEAGLKLMLKKSFGSPDIIFPPRAKVRDGNKSKQSAQNSNSEADELPYTEEN